VADRIFFHPQPILPIQTNTGAPSRRATSTAQTSSGDFGALLSAAQDKVLFSAHAENRMKERGIQLTEQDLQKLDTAVSDLEKKGARESLVYMDGTAFVVSVRNRTVITAMDGSRPQENIITNIDSAAIL